jgi:putative transposase
MRVVEGESSEWINKEEFTSRPFRWQEGYDACSYETKKIPVIATYIDNQEQHHQNKSFLVEYREFLYEFDVDYDERYLFKLPE